MTMMLLHILIVIGSVFYTNALPQCPQNSLSFDYDRCDPRRRSQCPSGFTCRRGNDTDRFVLPELPIYLCCETASMSIGDWFAEHLLTPNIFPQPPLAMLNSIEMRPLDANTAFPIVHTGDEVVLLTYPHYTTAMVQSVEFMSPPLQDGFLHVMTVIDPSSKPFAMFLVYNLPSVGYNRLPVPDTLQGLSGRASYVDNSTSVIKQDSYRSQYVVLVYRTNNPVLLGQNQIFTGQGPDFMAGCTDMKCMITNSVLSRELGQALAGSIFHITTKQTLFQTVEIISDNLTQAAANVTGHLLIVFTVICFCN